MHGVLPIFRIFDFDKWSSPPERQNRCTGFDFMHNCTDYSGRVVQAAYHQARQNHGEIRCGINSCFVHYGRVEVCLYVVSLFLLKLVWNYRRSLRHFNLCSCTFGVCCGVICCFHSVLSFISKVNCKKISGTYRLKSVFTLTNSSGKSETITVYSDEEMVG